MIGLHARNLVSRLDSKENLYNFCHQMSSFEAKMHQIRFRLGLSCICGILLLLLLSVRLLHTFLRALHALRWMETPI